MGCLSNLEKASCRKGYCICALGRIRTCDTRFRKPVLFPLSYEGSTGRIILATRTSAVCDVMR